MIRKIAVLALLLALSLTTLVTSASNPASDGCYVSAPASVNEGATYTATITCNNLALVFGMQFGTTLTGGGATTAATSYTPGTFSTAATSPLIIASNTLASYAVSRTLLNTANGNFTLGSFSLTAASGITTNGTETVDMPSASFKLSTIAGLPITGMLQASPGATTTIIDTPLSLLSGTIRVTSDGSVGSLSGLTMSLGDVAATSYSNQSTTGVIYKDFAVSNLQYVAASKAALAMTVNVDMTSHLDCTSTYSLADGANTVTGKVGVAGTITLKAGDVVAVSDNAINIQDATAIGAQFGSTSPTGEVDVNKDGVVDIYDLVHVGRNYNSTAGACG